MRAKPTTMQVQEEMKKLAEGGIGTFKSISEKEKVFFKPLPRETNKDQIVPLVNFEEYSAKFMEAIDAKYITAAQFQRLLLNSPDKDILISEYGLK